MADRRMLVDQRRLNCEVISSLNLLPFLIPRLSLLLPLPDQPGARGPIRFGREGSTLQ